MPEQTTNSHQHPARRWWLLAALALLVAGGAAGWFWLQPHEAATPQTRARAAGAQAPLSAGQPATQPTIQPQTPEAEAFRRAVESATTPSAQSTDCVQLMAAHAQAGMACKAQAATPGCVEDRLKAQGLNAGAYDLCKLFRSGPGAP